MSTTAPTILEKPKSRSRTGGGSKGGGGTGGGGGGGNQATVRLRIVVRHLPSLLKEEEFKEALAEYINEETTEWFSWIQGKIPSELVLPVFSTSRPNSITDNIKYAVVINYLLSHVAISNLKHLHK